VSKAALVAFDLLSLEADDLRQRPLEERREALARLVAGADAIRFSEALSAEGALVFDYACKLSKLVEPQLAQVPEPGLPTPVRNHAHTLSDFRAPTLSIECEPCGRHGRYSVARLMEQCGDAKLPELLYVLADWPEGAIAERL
jgi:hypothetical protein